MLWSDLIATAKTDTAVQTSENATAGTGTVGMQGTVVNWLAAFAYALSLLKQKLTTPTALAAELPTVLSLITNWGIKVTANLSDQVVFNTDGSLGGNVTVGGPSDGVDPTRLADLLVHLHAAANRYNVAHPATP